MPIQIRPTVIGLRLSDEEFDVLRALQAEQGSSASDILRRALRTSYPDRFAVRKPTRGPKGGSKKST